MTTAPRDLAGQIAQLQRDIRDLQRAPRLANASIEGFPLQVNDEDGVQRQTLGLQPDGTYTTTDVNGPPPPMPSLATLEARPGTLVVTWDGKFLDDVAAPADWDHVEVHVSDVSGYTPTDATQVATFNTLKGGSVTLALDPVAQYVVLQAVSTSRTESTPTPEAPGTPLPVATDGGVKTYYEDTPPLGLGADDDGALWFDTNDGNHPYRWDGPTLQWLTVRDGSIAAASAAAATAQTQANTALTAAQAAQATADGAIRTFYQSSPPWANGSSQPPEVVGDLWFDTDDGQAYRWNGTTWVIIEDNSIAAALAAAQNAQTTADGKITSYYQTTTPTVGELGDLWFDTNDANKPYYCSSIAPLTWTSIRDGSIAAAQSTADAALDAATTDGLAPTMSPDPLALYGLGMFIVRWTPIVNHDPVTYEVHVSPTLGFTPDTAPDGVYAHWWVSGTLDLNGFAAPDYTDIPTSSLTPGDRFLYPSSHDKFTWNGSTWTYNGTGGADGTAGQVIVISTGSTTRVGTTDGSQFTVRSLPGPPVALGDPDPRALNYDATYYVRIIARDADGSAPYSLQAPAGCLRVTGIDLAVDSVTAANIVAGTLTGELFSASVIVAGIFKTGETGQRVEWGVAGIKGYKADGSLMVSFPTADGEEALFDGEMIARGLTVLGGASFSGNSAMTADAVWTLMRGITSPSASPQLAVAYDTVQPSTSSLATADKTGPDLGTFDLVASEVTCIEWRPTLNCFSFFQIRPQGTREWYIDTSGHPVNIGAAGYHMDWADWEIWSATEIPGATAKSGHYLMFRYMPSGSDYYCYSPNLSLWRYSRQNGVAAPVIGNNGTDMFVAEVSTIISPGTHLQIRYFNLTGTGGAFPSPTVAYESSQGFNSAQGMACCTYHSTGFDMALGASRYMVADRGTSGKVRMLATNGTNTNSIFPGGTSFNWASANIDAETFEAPAANRRCTAWDGTQFWSYHGDGFLYKHTSERWDPVVSSSVYWGQLTFYDSDATGGTHETAPGTAKSYTAKRRSKNSFVPPTIPDNGGTNDPDRVRLYMARGATLPALAAFHLQYEGSVATAFQTLATATANPPAAGNFPAGTPAKWRNDDDTLVISGDGSIKGVTVSEGADRVAIRGPYGYFILNGTHTTAGAAFSNITNWQTEVALLGITLNTGTGVATIPRAGRYRITLQLAYPLSAGAGSIWADVRKNGVINPVLSTLVPPTTANSGTAAGSKTVTLAANDTLQCRSFKSTSGSAVIPASAELTFWQIEWVGP